MCTVYDRLDHMLRPTSAADTAGPPFFFPSVLSPWMGHVYRVIYCIRPSIYSMCLYISRVRSMTTTESSRGRPLGSSRLIKPRSLCSLTEKHIECHHYTVHSTSKKIDNQSTSSSFSFNLSYPLSRQCHAINPHQPQSLHTVLFVKFLFSFFLVF